MSSHSNFKKEECWSCIFYAGNKESFNSGERVFEDHSCSKWQIDPLTRLPKSLY